MTRTPDVDSEPVRPSRLAETFRIRTTDRVLLVGRTGSGKSTLAKALVRDWSHVFVIDVKGDVALPEARYVSNPEHLSSFGSTAPADNFKADGRPIIYRPSPEYWDVDWYDRVYRWVYDRQHCTCYTTEIYAVMRQNGAAPLWLRACMTRGRARGIRMVNETQRPSRVPLEILSEAEHLFVFRLQLADDRKRIAEVAGPGAWDPAHEHSFIYVDTRTGNSEEYILRR